MGHFGGKKGGKPGRVVTQLFLGLPGSIAQYRPDMEKRAEWPARGRAAVSPFPGDIVRSSPVQGK